MDGIVNDVPKQYVVKRYVFAVVVLCTYVSVVNSYISYVYHVSYLDCKGVFIATQLS